MKREKYIIPVAAFLIGGVVTYLFSPEKIKITKETKIVEVDKVIEVEVEVEKIVEVEIIKEVIKSEKRRTIISEYPDGTKITEEVYESNEEQLSRMRSKEQELYEQRLKEVLSEYTKTTKKEITITNPKRFNVSVGMNPLTQELAASATYSLFGPLTIGVIGTQNGVFPSVGIKF